MAEPLSLEKMLALAEQASKDAASEDVFVEHMGVKPQELLRVAQENPQWGFDQVFKRALDEAGVAHPAYAKLAGGDGAQPALRGATTNERMAQAWGNLCAHDEQTIQDRIGGVLFVTSDDPNHTQALYRSGGGMAYHYQDALAGVNGPTVFFTDRIPAGIEERVILREMFNLHAKQVDCTARQFLVESYERWGSWSRRADDSGKVAERDIFEAIEQRVEKLWPNLPGSDARFILAVQEAIKRGVEPDVNGKGVSGWLHEVFEHVKYPIKHTLGVELNLDNRVVLEMLAHVNPFAKEVSAMHAFERSRLRRERDAENEIGMALNKAMTLIPDPPEMEVGDLGWPVSKKVLGYYESGEPVLVVFECPDDENPDEVRIRTADAEGWDVTGAIVEWVHVPERPSLARNRQLSSDGDRSGPGM